MSKKANPARVGAFSLVAVALVAIGLIAFGGGELFERHTTYVSYFDDSVNGLTVGAQVTFQGVPVGQVTAIQAVVDPTTLEIEIPVLYELRQDAFIVHGGAAARQRLEQSRDELIEKGLRAQLSMQSLVTGTLGLELGFHPGTPAVLRANQDGLPEIPSITAPMQMLERGLTDLLAKAEELPIQDLFDKVLAVLNNAEDLLDSPEISETIAGLETLVNSPDTQALPQSLSAALDEATATLKDARSLVENVDGQVDPLVETVRETLNKVQPVLDKVQPLLDEAEQTLATARDALGADSELTYRITSTLQEVEAAMRALRVLADYMEQHPESLIRGKRSP